MAQTQDSMSYLDKLKTLHNLLLDCCQESESGSTRLQKFSNMLMTVGDMLIDEKRRLGYLAVYPIVNGCTQEALYEGTKEKCKIYIDNLIKTHPEMKGNIIVL